MAKAPAAAVGDEGPKSQDQDCELVTTIAPLHLTKTEVQLFEWARRDRFEAIKKLVEEKKINLNVQDNYNRTPLHFAASNGNLATVKVLVQARASLDVMDKLVPAFQQNNPVIGVAKAMVTIGSIMKYLSQGHTIIHFIAESNAVGILKYLYHKYHILKIDQEDNSGLTPFLVAAHRGNQLLMEVFVKQRCNVTHRDKRRRTAIHLASWKGHMVVVQYLLRIPELVKLINDLDADGKSALHLAVEANQQEIVRMLLNASADANIESDEYDAPLLEASRSGFHSCIDALLVHGAEKDMRTKNGNSALHVATLANLPDTIYFLRGQTPLHLAVEQNKLESLEALLIAGTKLDLKDKDEQTPLDVAARAEYTALVDLIIRADRWHQYHPDQAEDVKTQILKSVGGLPPLSPHDTFERSGMQANSFYDDEYGPQSASTTSSWENNRDLPGAYRDHGDDNSEDSPSGSTTTLQNDKLSNPSIDPQSTGDGLPQSTLEREDSFSPFIDPFSMYEEPVRSNSISHQSSERSHSRHSPTESDELALGFEASRIWDGNSNASGRSGNVNGTRQQQPEFNGNRRPSDGNRSSDDRMGDAKSMIQQERRLSNGELIVSLVDPMDNGAGQMPMNSNNDFSLLVYNQPYAEEMKILLFELSHKYFKPEDWKRLGGYWEFKAEHLAAIEFQEGGKNQYQDHGYRLLSIWLYGVDPEQSPLNELHKALIGVNRPKIAKKVRERVENTKKHKKGCRVQ